jgi:PPOX class probable F420-dependent enzyme
MTVIPAAVSGFIRDGRVGRLGTADPSGQPMVVPICYAFDGALLYSPVDGKPKTVAPAALRRIRNIQDNPKVSVVIDRYEEDWARLEWVMIQGDADVLTGGPEFARGAALLLAKYPQYRAMGLPSDRGLMIRVRPGRVRHWRSRGGDDGGAAPAS